MGEVWRAYDETLGRPVAVKLLLAQESDPTAVQRFRLEARTAGRLNHPHVVGVLDFGEHEGRLFLVMELVEGGSLARALAQRGPLPAERAAAIAAQAAAGLAAAHEQGVVHRDIKPANLLLDADGTVKIGDFGIARFLDDPAAALTGTGEIVGTSLYLAPERALGKPAGPPSDVYSLGCVLYQVLTGRAPFQADTAIAILHQHLDAAPRPPRLQGIALPPAFEDYLLDLLAKRPEDRPTARQAADWFAAGLWQRHAQPLPAVTPPPAPPTPAPTSPPPPAATASYAPHRPIRQAPAARRVAARRPGLVIGVAGAVVFLAAMLAGMAWFSPDRTAAETPHRDPAQSASPAAPPLGATEAPGTPSTTAGESPRSAPTAAPVPVRQDTPTQETDGGSQHEEDRKKQGDQDEDD
ncbi:protein kinase [Streptomyces coeruleoprunus]|uniref:non-specific serine/threonine protein kinase n=1 Tax=Streptomyces coeruleoprunus TaxID=285563 RepID=A0ABV9XAN0_9ACTN